MATTATDAYAIDEDGGPQRILRVALADGRQEWLVPGVPSDLRIDRLTSSDREVIATLSATNPALGGGGLYSVAGTRTILRTAGEPTMLAVGDGHAYFSLVDEADSSALRIERVSTDGTSRLLVARSRFHPRVGALTADRLIWATEPAVLAVKLPD